MNRSAVGSDRLRTCVSHALAKVRWAGHWEQVPQVPLDEMALPDDDADAERFWEKIWAQEQLRRAMADAREFYRARGKLWTFEAFHRSVVLKQPPNETRSIAAVRLPDLAGALSLPAPWLREQALGQRLLHTRDERCFAISS